MPIARSACRGLVSFILPLAVSTAACTTGSDDPVDVAEVDSSDNASATGDAARSSTEDDGGQANPSSDATTRDAAGTSDAAGALDAGGDAASAASEGGSMDASQSGSDAAPAAPDASATNSDASALDAGSSAEEAGATDGSASDAGSSTTPDAAAQPDASVSCADPELQADGTCRPAQGACANANGGCSQRCTSTSNGASCSCYPGFSLLVDGVSCRAFDWTRPSVADSFTTPSTGGLTPSGSRAPILQLDRDGRAAILWKSTSLLGAWLRGAARPAGGVWTGTPLAASESGVSQSMANVPVPRALFRLPAGGEVGVLQSLADPITVAQLPDGSWSALASAQTAETHQAQDPQLDVAFNTRGEAMLVWTVLQSGRTHIWARYFTPSSGLTAPLLVSADLAWNSVLPHVALDVSGNATVVWQQDDGARFSVRVRQYRPSTGFGPELRADSAELETTDAHVATDSDGRVMVAYLRKVAGRASLWARRRGSDWETAQEVAGQGATASADPRIIRLVAGARGTAYLLFQSEGLRASRFRTTLGWSTAAPLGPLFDLATDPLGGVFSPPPPTAQIGLDELGNAVILWRSAAATLSFTRYVSGTGWFRVSTLPGAASGDPGLVVLPDGQAMAAWAQLINPGGSAQNGSMNLLISQLQASP